MKHLRYNQVWEDYDVDRIALAVEPGSTILMIASGGCNALNTLLEDAGTIYAVDQNQAQVRLLEEKIRAIRRGHSALWNDFGIPAQRRDGSVYSYGSYSRFRWVRQFFRATCGKHLERFLQSPDLQAQEKIYVEEIEPRLWRLPVRLFPTGLASFCGMHWRQVVYSARSGQFFLEQACRQRLRRILTTFPIRTNYFWHQMLTGQYADEQNVPPYLDRNNFSRLQDRCDRIHSVHSDLLGFLKNTESNLFSSANLLDLLEFVSPSLRISVLRELHRTCKPKATVLFRTFAPQISLDQASNYFAEDVSLSHRLSEVERTASYGGVHICTVVK
ncbi:MAG: DUF3419 family protein [Leptospirales bacterium]|nr:DUF3419 family protein [Leptospirales bacterium]